MHLTLSLGLKPEFDSYFFVSRRNVINKRVILVNYCIHESFWDTISPNLDLTAINGNVPICN